MNVIANDKNEVKDSAIHSSNESAGTVKEIDDNKENIAAENIESHSNREQAENTEGTIGASSILIGNERGSVNPAPITEADDTTHGMSPQVSVNTVPADISKTDVSIKTTSTLTADPVTQAVRELNRDILAAAVKLSAAKTAYEKAKVEFDEASSFLKQETSLLTPKEVLESARAYVGQKKAVLRLAEDALLNAQTAYDSAIRDAEFTYELAEKAVQSEYDDAVSSAEQTYRNALVQARAVYDEAIAKAEEVRDQKAAAADSDYAGTVDGINQAYQTASDQYESDYETACADAQARYDTAVANAQDIFDKNLSEAMDAYSKAMESARTVEFQDAQDAYNAALEAQKRAVENKESMVAALETAKEKLQEAISEQETVNSHIAELKRQKEEAENRLSDSKAALIAATAQYETASQKDSDAKAAVEAARDNVESAQTAYDNAVEELSTAEAGTAIENYDQKVAEAQKRVADAEKAVSDAQAQIDKGSYGFFEAQGATEAMQVIDYMMSDAVEESRRINLGDAHDATSLDLMKVSIEMAATGNKLRTTDNNFPNLEPLKVSNTMMAIAQANAVHSADPYSGNTVDHWANIDGGLGAVNNNWSTGENLAWGFRLPTHKEDSGYVEGTDVLKSEMSAYSGWYNAEKKTFEEGGDGETGHYANITHNDYVTTGFAISNDSRNHNCFAQEFGFGEYYTAYNPITGTYRQVSFSLHPDDMRLYTVEEYYDLFMDYYNTVMDAKKNSEADLASAREALDALNAQDEGVFIDQAAVAEAKQKLEDAQTTLDAANTALSQANLSAEETARTVIEASDAIDAAEETVETAEADVQETETALETAEEDFSNAQIVVSEAEAVIEDQEILVAEAEEGVFNANEAVRNAEVKLNEETAKAESLIIEEKEALEEAQSNTIVEDVKASEQVALDEALKNAKDTLDEGISNAENERDTALKEAESTYTQAVDEAEAEKESAVNNAESELTAAETEADAERKEAIDDAEAHKDSELSAAREEKDSKTESVTTAVVSASENVKSAKDDSENAEKKLADLEEKETILSGALTELEEDQMAYDNLNNLLSSSQQ